MSNEFVIKNGLISKGNVVVTGSVTANSFTGSLYGTASWAQNAVNSITASYVSSSNIVGTVSSASYYTAGNYKCRQVPTTGAINGSNAVFAWVPQPIIGTETVYRNGILQDGSGNDYTLIGGSLTFNSAPLTGDKVCMCYYA